MLPPGKTWGQSWGRGGGARRRFEMACWGESTELQQSSVTHKCSKVHTGKHPNPSHIASEFNRISNRLE